MAANTEDQYSQDPQTPPTHPLGPLLVRTQPSQARAVRWRATAVALACLVPLGLAVWLTPDPSGVGTHRQLGLAHCSLMVTTGIPCPTCGMTTAFCYAVRCRWLTAFAVQPGGCLLALGAMLTLAASAAEFVTGVGWRVNWYRVSPLKTALGAAGLFLAAWIYKIMATRA